MLNSTGDHLLLFAGEDPLRAGAFFFTFLTNFALVRPACFALFCCGVAWLLLFGVCLFVCLLSCTGHTNY